MRDDTTHAATPDDVPTWLAKVRARYEASTPGPWQYGYDDGSGRVDTTDAMWRGGTVLTLAGENYPTPVSGCSLGMGCGVGTDEDADFIAHAHQDIPALLALVEEQQEEFDGLSDDYQGLSQENVRFAARIAHLERQVEVYEELRWGIARAHSLYFSDGISLLQVGIGVENAAQHCADALREVKE